MTIHARTMALAACALLALTTQACATDRASPVARAEAPPAQERPWLADPFPSTYAPGPRADMLIRNATVLDGAGGRIDGGDVLIRGSRIAAVGRGLANPGGVQEVDARGRWVTPGVIDVHSHDGTYVVPLTSIDSEASDVSELSDMNVADTRIETAINPQDVAFSRALRNGVTTIQVLPGSSPIFGGRSVVLKPIRATTVDAMKFPGAPAAMKMTCGENPKSHGAESHRGPTSRQGVVAYIRRAFMDARDHLESVEKGPAEGRGGRRGPRHDLKRDTLAGVLNGDIRVNVHCYRADDMAMVMSVADEFGFKVAAFHHATEAYKIPERLKRHGACAAVWGDWWGFKMEAQDAVRANAALLDEAGACAAMHSDSPASGQRLNLEAAKVAGGALQAGLKPPPPERMIRWTTSNAARILGLEDRIGTLAPGYAADVVIWSGDPFSIYSKADLVLVDGAVAFDRAAPPAEPASDFEVGRRAMAKP